MALAALLWHIGLHTDSAYLDQAEAVVHAVKEISPDDPAVWALLTLVYASMPGRRVSEQRNAASEMRRLAKAKNSRKAGNPYLQVLPCYRSATLKILVYCCMHQHLYMYTTDPNVTRIAATYMHPTFAL